MPTDPDVASYQNDLQLVLMCARLLRSVDIQTHLTAIAKAEVTGPILDPTLFREKSRAMREDAAMLRAALPLREWAEKVLHDAD